MNRVVMLRDVSVVIILRFLAENVGPRKDMNLLL